MRIRDTLKATIPALLALTLSTQAEAGQAPCDGCTSREYVVHTATDPRLKMGDVILERRLSERPRSRHVGVTGYDRVVMEDGMQLVDTVCEEEDEVRIHVPALTPWQEAQGFSVRVKIQGDLADDVVRMVRDGGGSYLSFTQEGLARQPRDENGYHTLHTRTTMELLYPDGTLCQSVILPYDLIYSETCVGDTAPGPSSSLAPTGKVIRIKRRASVASAPPAAPVETREYAPAQQPVSRPTPQYVPQSYALPQCADGIDNDGDGRKDYPEDPGCTSRGDDQEGDAKKRVHERRPERAAPVHTPVPRASPPRRPDSAPPAPVASTPKNKVIVGGAKGSSQFSSTTEGEREAVGHDTQGVTIAYERRSEDFAAKAAVTATTGDSGERAFGTPVGETVDAFVGQLRLEKAFRLGDSPFALDVELGFDYKDITLGDRQGYWRSVTSSQEDYIPSLEVGPLIGRLDRTHVSAGYGVALQSVHERFLHGQEFKVGASEEYTPFWFLKGRIGNERFHGDFRGQYMPDNTTLFTNGLHELRSTSENRSFRLELGGDVGKPGAYGWFAGYGKEIGREHLFDLESGLEFDISTDIDSIRGGATYSW